MKKKLLKGCLTGNQLKLIALITMTIDHIGLAFFPGRILFRIIGRIAFPIFAYMIAEGCKYTKNKKKYFLTISVLAVIFQHFYSYAKGNLYQSILVTFSLSILLIYAIDYMKKKQTFKSVFYTTALFSCVYIITTALPLLLKRYNFNIDYGLWGVMLPVFISVGEKKTYRLLFLSIGLFFLSLSLGYIQWFSLITIPIIFLYNGKRGKYNIKKLFYIYYPAHLVVIYLIDLAIKFIK